VGGDGLVTLVVFLEECVREVCVWGRVVMAQVGVFWYAGCRGIIIKYTQ